MQSPSPLPSLYYLSNFRELLAGVRRQYGDFLPPAHSRFLAAFEQLSDPAQALLVRLLSRKGTYFRLAKLNYDEIGPFSEPVQELVEAQLVSLAPPVQMADLLALFTKSEWQGLIKKGLMPELDVKLALSCSRQQLDALLLTQTVDAESASQWLGEAIVSLVCQDVFSAMKLLYFGNARQDLSEFVLRDLALTRYEQYPLNVATRLFSDWSQVERHLDVYRRIERLQQLDLTNNSQLQALLDNLPEDSSDLRLGRRVGQLINSVARQLERNGALQVALQAYQKTQLPPARERLARVLVSQGLPEQALAQCRRIVEAPLDDDELDFAHAFAHRTAKKLPLAYWPKPQVYQPPTEQWRLPKEPGEWGARLPEWAVAQKLASTGQCFYVENRLFMAVFALVYWPVFFAPVAGAFSHPFQAQPHDLYSADFMLKRSSQCQQVERWLEQREPEGVLPVADIEQRWQEKYGINHSLIAWSAISPTVLNMALTSIPLDDWRNLFAHLWAGLRSRRKGLPDLIYFPENGGYELIEVKGPGDKLQTHQRRWLAYCQQQGIAHRVVNVVWQ